MTLTREQVIEMANECGFVAYGEDAGEYRIPTPAFHSRMERFAALIESATEKRAYTAGRAAGLGEAAQKVRHILADCEEQDIDDPELESIAAAIEQLKEQSK